MLRKVTYLLINTKINHNNIIKSRISYNKSINDDLGNDKKKTGRKLRFSKEAIEERLKRKKDKRSVEGVDVKPFQLSIKEQIKELFPLKRNKVEIVGINIGLTCNLSCEHCHVESSPTRRETMSELVAQRTIDLVKNTPTVHTIDITGGAPEMHQQFKYLVKEMSALNKTVIDRCNLTILLEKGFEDIPKFLSENNVTVIASMPCYSADNVNKQRGDKVFDRSIEALQILNSHGYGIKDNLPLNLVYNPIGFSLSPNQKSLEKQYKHELKKNFDIEFNNLYCFNNMPIKRFADQLRKENKLYDYMKLLQDNFNPSKVGNIMCKNSITIDHAGGVYDCDFNFALEIPSGMNKKHGVSIFELESFNNLNNSPISTGKHCYACTAGEGFSCQGAI
eukprot:TRINITY_DN578_c0_g1_i1.p1 TRINITY_DN578_c0_g1~~TRINITY_DN578_c0_g1_i1.p1  ORF type:complete len:392 (+),score=88.76 TRINITY_DN578_c0_g1_i1:293-1468(+)